MSRTPRNGGFPVVEGVDLIQDLSQVSSPITGFARRYRHRIKSRLSDGTRSETFIVDYIDRAPGKRDAVAALPYAIPEGDPAQTVVILRRQLRYAVYVANGAPMILETVAGIIEDGEAPERTVVRELWEEAGIRAELDDIEMLGGPFFICPGLMTEQVYLGVSQISPSLLEPGALPPPPTDGSPFEVGAELVTIRLSDALEALDQSDSEFSDAKTEVALTRLARKLSKTTP